ncbi:MAG: DEAD/DEAH box helicase, partial [Chitinophagaceae bacterium]
MKKDGMNATLYDYQQRDLAQLFKALEGAGPQHRLLYQLPTGGGKTVMFSEIARKFINETGRKVVILTHRLELCRQTSTTLRKAGIRNKVINSDTKKINETSFECYVAMVETLRNRIEDGKFDTSQTGLLIIDEAHHNSFSKLFSAFDHALVIGVTATPLSSDSAIAMHDIYQQLIIGEGIEALIKNGFLARPTTWRYDVEINSLEKGSGGDFTISTSDELYSSPAMLQLLMDAYQSHSKNKKTLIFNNGIFTSKNVCQFFSDAGYDIRHLDNTTTAAERENILQWFRKTSNAILTSVSILTTGFDEPTIRTVILNRATTSLTLFHQMIGRGSRSLPKKKTFTIIDLGNNTERFGPWEAKVDWQYIFDHPDEYTKKMNEQLSAGTHHMRSDLRSLFPDTLELSFDVQAAYRIALSEQKKPINVLHESIRQHALMC